MVVLSPQCFLTLSVWITCRKQLVHKTFLASGCLEEGRSPPSFSYFNRVWNKYCSHIKLKKVMRFALCDICVTSGEALDRERMNGGPGWKTREMEVIRRGLVEHHEVIRGGKPALRS